MWRDRWMAVGAFVVVGLSFQPWFSTRVEVDVNGAGEVWGQSKNAWLASSRWSVAIVAGVVATVVWFGAVRSLQGRKGAVVAAALLLGAVGLVGQEWWLMHESGGPTITVAYLTTVNPQDRELTTREPLSDVPVVGTVQRDKLAVSHDVGYAADLESAHYVAWAALLVMLVVAATGWRRGVRPDQSDRPSSGNGMSPP